MCWVIIAKEDMSDLKKEKPKNFTLILYRKGSGRQVRISRFETKSVRRFRRKLKQLPDEFDAILRVSYGGGVVNYGDYSTFEALMLAFNAFTEK